MKTKIKNSTINSQTFSSNTMPSIQKVPLTTSKQKMVPPSFSQTSLPLTWKQRSIRFFSLSKQHGNKNFIFFKKHSPLHNSSLSDRFFSQRHFTLVSLKNVSINLGYGTILDDISLNLYSGDKIVLVGDNGSGKSTLAKIIAGEIEVGSGSLFYKKDITIGYLPQNPEAYAEQNNITTVSELTSLINNHYHVPAKKIFSGLNIDKIPKTRNFSSLSGGEKTRMVIANLLIQQPDLLILDEPTNHLDLDAQVWIETYIKNTSSTLLLITHDRNLIDSINCRMCEINAKEKQLEFFKGGYSTYIQMKKKLFEKKLREYEKFQIEKKRIKNELNKFNERLSKQTKKTNLSQKFKLETLNRKLLAKEEVEIEKPDKLRNISFDFYYEKLHGEAISFKGIAKKYNNKYVLNPCSNSVLFDDHIVVTGDNGSGKSTLVKILAGLIKPDHGLVVKNKLVKIGYLPQEHSYFHEEQTVLEFFTNALRIHKERIIGCLVSKYNFSYDSLFQDINELSIGQQRRLLIAKFTLEGANVLILDEPTNHMDLLSTELLEEALLNYPGTIIAISHDRRFIQKISKKIWNIKDGTIDFIGKSPKNFKLLKFTP